MPWHSIKKLSATWVVPPNLVDYHTTCATFSCKTAQRELDALPGEGSLNMVHESVDRHVKGRWRDRLALRRIRALLKSNGPPDLCAYAPVDEWARYANDALSCLS